MDRLSTTTSGAVQHFHGREKDLDWLYGLFRESRSWALRTRTGRGRPRCGARSAMR